MEDLKNLIDGLVDASYGDGLFVRDDVLTNLDQLNIPEKYLDEDDIGVIPIFGGDISIYWDNIEVDLILHYEEAYCMIDGKIKGRIVSVKEACKELISILDVKYKTRN